MSTQGAHAFDPVTLTVFANVFSSVAEEMGTALCRSALSPNIKERRDFSCLVCDADGELVAQAAHIPVHLGSAPVAVKLVLDQLTLAPGDVVVLNDPFRGGTHLPDLTMIAPVFLQGDSHTPSFFVANRAHHADVGGMSAGSMPLSREIFQEGLIIPPVRIVAGGRLVEDIRDMILANVRTPPERRGDLMAQVSALERGIGRLRDIAGQRGRETVIAYGQALKDHAEFVMRSVLSALPDGVYSAHDVLDDECDSPAAVHIKTTVSIHGDEARVDFGGSSPQVPGNLNAVKAITVSSVLYVFRLFLPEDIPSNAGMLRPITVEAPEGSVVNARPPAAVAGGNVETSQRMVDVLLRALAPALPDRIPACSQGTMNNLTIGASHMDPARSFAYYETVGGGAGGGPTGPGTSGIHSHMTNTMNTPIEALEAGYPLRVEGYRIRRASGGRGTHAGGDGLERDIRLLAPATVTIISERRGAGPPGLAGGQAGLPGINLRRKNGEVTEELPSKATFHGDAGEVVSIRTPGGGGWGPPGVTTDSGERESGTSGQPAASDHPEAHG